MRWANSRFADDLNFLVQLAPTIHVDHLGSEPTNHMCVRDDETPDERIQLIRLLRCPDEINAPVPMLAQSKNVLGRLLIRRVVQMAEVLPRLITKIKATIRHQRMGMRRAWNWGAIGRELDTTNTGALDSWIYLIPACRVIQNRSESRTQSLMPAAKIGRLAALASATRRSIINAVLPFPGWPVNSSIGISGPLRQERLCSTNCELRGHRRGDHGAGHVELHESRVRNDQRAELTAGRTSAHRLFHLINPRLDQEFVGRPGKPQPNHWPQQATAPSWTGKARRAPSAAC